MHTFFLESNISTILTYSTQLNDLDLFWFSNIVLQLNKKILIDNFFLTGNTTSSFLIYKMTEQSFLIVKLRSSLKPQNRKI